MVVRIVDPGQETCCNAFYRSPTEAVTIKITALWLWLTPVVGGVPAGCQSSKAVVDPGAQSAPKILWGDL